MKSFAKKFLSLALAAVLLLGVFPMAAMAAGSPSVVFHVGDDVYTVPVNEDGTVNTDSVEYGQAMEAGFTYGESHGGYLGWVFQGSGKDADINAIIVKKNNQVNLVVKVANTKPEDKPEVKPEDKPEVKPEDKPEVKPEDKPEDKPEVKPEEKKGYIRYYTNDGDELTALSKEIKAGHVLTDADLYDASNSYVAGAVPTGFMFNGWKYMNGGKDVITGVEVTNVNLQMKLKKVGVYHTVTLLDANKDPLGKTIEVKDGEALSAKKLKDLAPKAPEGMEYDTWKFADNNQNVAGVAIEENEEIFVVYRKIEGYNPRPDGPAYLYELTFDENLPSEYKNSTKTTYEVKENQRLGTLFGKGQLPIPSCDRYVFKGWYLCDANGKMTNNQVTEETLFSWGRNVTVKASWALEARVKLMIYRNNTDNLYDSVQLYGYAVGDVIYTKDLDIKDYYKNGNKPFKWEGWFDRGGWTLFKAKENPKPVTSMRTVDLDGTTTLFAMVYDENAPANANPDRTNPKTGDESMIIATTAVMLVSAGALAVFFMDRKRRNG